MIAIAESFRIVATSYKIAAVLISGVIDIHGLSAAAGRLYTQSGDLRSLGRGD
jgi:hypothetical protein